MAQGRDIMKGRHFVGGKTASPGKIRGGQGEPAGNRPITGTNVAMSKKKPFVPDAKETSQDEMRFIAQPPMPFKDGNSVPQIPTGTGARGAVPGSVQKPYAGKSGNAAPRNPGGSAVGYSTLPNQSKQIGGRNGFPPPARKAGSVSGFKSKRNASFYGE